MGNSTLTDAIDYNCSRTDKYEDKCTDRFGNNVTGNGAKYSPEFIHTWGQVLSIESIAGGYLSIISIKVDMSSA
jgi:hypothetical protein